MVCAASAAVPATLRAPAARKAVSNCLMSISRYELSTR
jgi:hypothetical protein